MKNFRNYLVGGLAVVALWASALPANAQPDPSGTPTQRGQGRGHRGGGMAGFLKQLNLTDDQKAKVKNILGSTEAGKERRQAIMGVLDDTQRAKLRGLMAQARKNRGGGGSPRPSGTPKPTDGDGDD